MLAVRISVWTGRPDLHFTPTDALIDEPVAIVLTGAVPGEHLQIRTRAPLDAQHVFVASGEFVADSTGRVDVAHQPSLGGTYKGVDAMALLGKTVPQSSWTWRGTPVEFVPHVPVPEFTQQFSHAPPYALRPLYEASLRDASAAARAAIHVERINGPVLLISGRDDQMIPSDAMAESVMARLRNSGHRYPDKHLSYQAAGHQIGIPFLPVAPRTSVVPFASGGTRAGYAEADAKSWVIVLGYLESIAVP